MLMVVISYLYNMNHPLFSFADTTVPSATTTKVSPLDPIKLQSTTAKPVNIINRRRRDLDSRNIGRNILDVIRRMSRDSTRNGMIDIN